MLQKTKIRHQKNEREDLQLAQSIVLNIKTFLKCLWDVPLSLLTRNSSSPLMRILVRLSGKGKFVDGRGLGIPRCVKSPVITDAAGP
jgi:hypothetical protein